MPRRIFIFISIVMALAAGAGSPVPAAETGLSVSREAVIQTLINPGPLTRADFSRDIIGDLEEGVYGESDSGSFSVTLAGPENNVSEIQVYLSTLGDLSVQGLEAMARLARLAVSKLPAPDDSLPPAGPEMPEMSDGALWVSGMFRRAWRHWPGRGVRVEWQRDGRLLVFEGVPPDFLLLTIAADDIRVRPAWLRLTSWSRDGIGTDPMTQVVGHEVPAIAEIRSAAESDDAAAQYRMGDIHYFGLGTEKDDSQALRWYRMAAELGYAPAQFSVGVSYWSGTGVERSHADAARWNRMAAEQGYAPAAYMLAYIYDETVGGKQASENSFEWCRIAGELGYGPAQLCMAEKFHDGRGTVKDDSSAYMWATIAAENGDPGWYSIIASRMRERFGASLTARQTAQADRRASAWQPTPFDELRSSCGSAGCFADD